MLIFMQRLLIFLCKRNNGNTQNDQQCYRFPVTKTKPLFKISFGQLRCLVAFLDEHVIYFPSKLIQLNKFSVCKKVKNDPKLYSAN